MVKNLGCDIISELTWSFETSEVEMQIELWGHLITTWTRGGEWVVSEISTNFYEGQVGGQLKADVDKKQFLLQKMRKTLILNIDLGVNEFCQKSLIL